MKPGSFVKVRFPNEAHGHAGLVPHPVIVGSDHPKAVLARRKVGIASSASRASFSGKSVLGSPGFLTVLINTLVSIQSQSTARRNGQSEREKHAGQAIVQGTGFVVELEFGGHLARLARV